ncbi:hypothetical protein RRG08_035175 [Elysia crispata]|uniref:Uncharacterized protein n=1 Tax=Elysia crispata TaxID=231223 RepID=A0AAE1AXN8_9GAST|nr:hypothetical protein RRG08_035175 [Elysia crispata]
MGKESYKKANWEKFQEIADGVTKNLFSHHNSVDSNISLFTKSIIQAAKLSIPRGRRKDLKPYWNQRLENLHKQLDTARDALEKQQTDFNRQKPDCPHRIWTSSRKSSMQRSCQYLQEYPLRNVLHKDAAWQRTETHDQAFQNLKNLVLKEMTLSYDNLNKVTVLKVDRSLHLLQDAKPIAFASKSMTDTDRAILIPRTIKNIMIESCEKAIKASGNVYESPRKRFVTRISQKKFSQAETVADSGDDDFGDNTIVEGRTRVTLKGPSSDPSPGRQKGINSLSTRASAAWCTQKQAHNLQLRRREIPTSSPAVAAHAPLYTGNVNKAGKATTKRKAPNNDMTADVLMAIREPVNVDDDKQFFKSC